MHAFADLSFPHLNLEKIQFCSGIKEFMLGEKFQHWWNNGFSKTSRVTYNFLFWLNILQRLDRMTVWHWRRDDIHHMLTQIPSFADNLDSYFESIESKLIDNERDKKRNDTADNNAEIEEDDDDGTDDDNGTNDDDYIESTTSVLTNFLYTNGKVVPGNVSNVTVDPSVKILCRPFAHCTRLTTVHLLEGLERIGGHALEQCSMLSQINIPSSVRVIGYSSFGHCRRLTSVHLPEGLERIGVGAFAYCESLSHITIPSSVKEIGNRAFYDCVSLQTVVLPEGLEELGGQAFCSCTSLQSINIPSRIKSVEDEVFSECLDLRNVDLSEGLEYIGDGVFADCPSLRHIRIPSTVNWIDPCAFPGFEDVEIGDLNLKIQFCHEIEEFLSGESFRHWWNNVSLDKSFRIYNILIRYNIRTRLDMLPNLQWRANIHDMLKLIPSFGFDNKDYYFKSIDSKLTNYEILPGVIPPLLELAIWKSTILEQTGPNVDNVSDLVKWQCRVDCGVCVIIPRVLSFL